MAVFCYLLGDESSKKCALIDPAFDTDKILNSVKRNGYRVIHIINTHCHADHTAGNRALKEKTGAKILIHELDSKALGKTMNRVFSGLLGGKGPPRPDILLREGDIIEIGKGSLKVIHTPGHTRGCICLYTEGNVFTGDTLFNYGIGRYDLIDSDGNALISGIKTKLLTLPPETIVHPGHGPDSTIATEIRANPFLK